MKEELCVNESIFKDIETAFNSRKQVTMRLSSGYNGILESMNVVSLYPHKSFEFGIIKEKNITAQLTNTKEDILIPFNDLYKYEVFINGENEKTGKETKVFLKENSDQSKFKELCDLAYKAAIDGNVKISHLTTNAIEINFDGDQGFYLTPSSDDCDIQDGINAINDLYCEEFVIDEEQDLLKIKKEYSGTLANGIKFHVDGIIERDDNPLILIVFDTRNFYWATIEILKGATIKQKKVD